MVAGRARAAAAGVDVDRRPRRPAAGGVRRVGRAVVPAAAGRRDRIAPARRRRGRGGPAVLPPRRGRLAERRRGRLAGPDVAVAAAGGEHDHHAAAAPEAAGPTAVAARQAGPGRAGVPDRADHGQAGRSGRVPEPGPVRRQPDRRRGGQLAVLRPALFGPVARAGGAAGRVAAEPEPVPAGSASGRGCRPAGSRAGPHGGVRHDLGRRAGRGRPPNRSTRRGTRCHRTRSTTACGRRWNGSGGSTRGGRWRRRSTPPPKAGRHRPPTTR